MGSKDVFVNLVGGLKVDDPGLDLSIISSIASSTMDKPVNKSTVLCGEVGLAGEVRSINRIEHRLAEAQSLGFKVAIIPSSNLKIGKSNTPTNLRSLSKYCMFILYKIPEI